ncbi:zinc dependent phospholipase C family protein [Paludicola sp. MB14-C6]|uniref:zinc dependent phospholipase C family protein n=1 Tax=Paludihabitans sp. MB14-C6 TaxID=3070656 RepID=UPI0027DC7DD7|nr:zinc dependent phospholipase C family protein [Paludicola sp. MB14-C6]WMJ21853.1 zinc dependent phospholipase C family protein [Paludicola sp. MB14-C6]
MPASMVHLYIGYQFQQSCHLVHNKPQFYLGCIAPDAVNLDGFAPKDIRYTAHLRKADLDDWMQNVIDFYTEYKEKLDDDFLLGYVLHIFSDIAWDKKYDHLLWAALKKRGLPKEQQFGARWEELFAFDQLQFDEKWWTEHVALELKKSKAIPINNIDADLIDRYRIFKVDKNLQALQYDTPRVLTQELMDEYANYAIALLKNAL